MNKYALKIFDEDISKYKSNVFKLAEWIYKANTINIFDYDKREDYYTVVKEFYLKWLEHYKKYKEVYNSDEYKFAIFIYKKLFNAKMYVEDVEITDAFRYSLLAEKDTKELNTLKENYKNDLKEFIDSLREVFVACDKKALSGKIKENYYYNNQVAQLCPMIDINRKELLSNVLNEILDKEEVTFNIEPLFPSEEFLSDAIEVYDLIKLILKETKLVGKYEVIYIYKLYRKELYKAIKEFFKEIHFEVTNNFIEEFIDNIDDYNLSDYNIEIPNGNEDKVPISANIAELQNYELSKDILYMNDKRTYTKRQFINLSFYFSFDLDMTEELLNMSGYTIKHSYDPVDKILKNCFTIGLNQEYTSVVVKTETGIEITKRLFDNGKIGVSYENFLILQKKLDSVETLTSSEQDKYNKCLEHTINYFTQFYNKKLASIKKREDVIKNIESDIDKLSKEAGSLLMSTEEKDKIKYERINEKVYNLEIEKSKKEKSLNRIRNKKYNYKTVFVNSDDNNTITFTLKEIKGFIKKHIN